MVAFQGFAVVWYIIHVYMHIMLIHVQILPEIFIFSVQKWGHSWYDKTFSCIFLPGQCTAHIGLMATNSALSQFFFCYPLLYRSLKHGWNIAKTNYPLVKCSCAFKVTFWVSRPWYDQTHILLLNNLSGTWVGSPWLKVQLYWPLGHMYTP